ncbi:hypothetical protein V1525DRAFT_431567 [Lipomyces kononenkoae]|uniref:Uncharacterized protein n=1 Tax=Lipomyces kononenkoae TaxID=34357 RepID=A0ACC3T755_LIPKO
MSRASKITLVLTSLSAVGIIYGVHFVQEAQQQSMYQGVVKDRERQRIKQERADELRLQQALQKEYEMVQPVADRPKT